MKAGTMFRAFAASVPEASSRSVKVIASTDRLDAAGRIVAQDWDLTRFQSNPVVLWNHGVSDALFSAPATEVTLPIGYASDVRVEGSLLKATLAFVDASANPLAEKVWQGIRQGSVRGVSIGWHATTASEEIHEGQPVTVLRGNSLVEISIVAIPANPEAIVENERLAASLRQRASIGLPTAQAVGSALPALTPREKRLCASRGWDERSYAADKALIVAAQRAQREATVASDGTPAPAWPSSLTARERRLCELRGWDPNEYASDKAATLERYPHLRSGSG